MPDCTWRYVWEGLHEHRNVDVTLIHRHDYQQALTKLPRVAAGTRSAAAVRIQLDAILARTVRIFDGTITGLDLAQRPGEMILAGSSPDLIARAENAQIAAVTAGGRTPKDGETIPGLLTGQTA